jgi:hypothetical protein
VVLPLNQNTWHYSIQVLFQNAWHSHFPTTSNACTWAKQWYMSGNHGNSLQTETLNLMGFKFYPKILDTHISQCTQLWTQCRRTINITATSTHVLELNKGTGTVTIGTPSEPKYLTLLDWSFVVQNTWHSHFLMNISLI